MLYPARSSLARLKLSEEKKQHTGEESFSLSLLFSFLHLSSLLFHHSWVVWYLTFTLLQQGLGSKSSERKLVSPLSYSVVPLFLFPLPLSFLLSLLLFSSPVFKQTITVMVSALQSGKGKKRCWNTLTPTFLPIMYSVRRPCISSTLWWDCTTVFASFSVEIIDYEKSNHCYSLGLQIHLLKNQCSFVI